MDAKLVHATGFGLSFDEGDGAKRSGGPLKHAEVGGAGGTIRVDHLPNPNGGGGDFALAQKGRFEGALLPIWPA